MDQNFADRLARIQASNKPLAVPGGAQADLIGTTGTPASLEPYPHQAPKTYDQKFNLAVVNNLILGGIWMSVTGYIAANFNSVIKGFLGADATAEALTNLQWGMGTALAVSFALFYWVAREAIRDVGKVHGMPASLAIGGVLGLVAGAGPVTVFNVLVDLGYL